MFEPDNVLEIITVICDEEGCDSEEEYDSLDFSEVSAEIKRDGWRIFKREGEWIHACPEHYK